MKAHGQTTARDVKFGPLVFKRGPTEFLVFYAQPVWSYAEFDQVCPRPPTPQRFTRDGKEDDHDNPAHKVAMQEYALRRWSWLVIKSLEPSFKPIGDLEWERVKPDDPRTWGLVEDELRDGLAVFEFQKVMALVDEANALDAEKLAANAETFFQIAAQEAAAEKATSQSGEPESSKSSEPANDSE